MYKRAYAVALKPGITEAERVGLIRVLEQAPGHIPGMLTSIVRPSLPPTRYDLIWDNSFTTVEAYTNYLSHPYHCNVIDHYMYRESPGAAIGESLCLRWTVGADDTATPIAGAIPITDAVIADEGKDVVVEDFSSDPMASSQSEGPLILLEQVDVLPGRDEEYLEALKSEYLPMIKGRGLRLIMSLRSPVESGEHEIVTIWELDSWSAFVDFRAFFQFENEPASTDWVRRISALRTGGRRRLMHPIELSAMVTKAR